MRTISAFLFALVLATGAAMAQTGGGAGGGTAGSGGDASGQSANQPGPSGVNTGKDASANPTAAQCAQGWNSTMSMSKSEFDMKCQKQ